MVFLKVGRAQEASNGRQPEKSGNTDASEALSQADTVGKLNLPPSFAVSASSPTVLIPLHDPIFSH